MAAFCFHPSTMSHRISDGRGCFSASSFERSVFRERPRLFALQRRRRPACDAGRSRLPIPLSRPAIRQYRPTATSYWPVRSARSTCKEALRAIESSFSLPRHAFGPVPLHRLSEHFYRPDRKLWWISALYSSSEISTAQGKHIFFGKLFN